MAVRAVLDRNSDLLRPEGDLSEKVRKFGLQLSVYKLSKTVGRRTREHRIPQFRCIDFSRESIVHRHEGRQKPLSSDGGKKLRRAQNWSFKLGAIVSNN